MSLILTLDWLLAFDPMLLGRENLMSPHIVQIEGGMWLSFAPITTVQAVPKTYLELETSEIYEF